MSIDNSAVLCVGFLASELWQLPEEREIEYVEVAVKEMNQEIIDYNCYPLTAETLLKVIYSSVHQEYMVVVIIGYSAPYNAVEMKSSDLADVVKLEAEITKYFDQVPTIWLMNLQN